MTKKFGNSRGMTLVQVLITAAIGAVILLALSQGLMSVFKGQKSIQAKDQQRELTAEIRYLLSDRDACKNSFGGNHDVVQGFTVDTLKDKNNNVKYDATVGQKDKSGMLTIREFKITGFIPDPPPLDTLQGTASLLVGLQRPSDALGSQMIAPDYLNIKLKKNAAGNITDCFAMGNVSDSYWQASSANPSDIIFNAGNVGIGIGNPTAALDIAATQPTAIFSGIKIHPAAASTDSSAGILLYGPTSVMGGLGTASLLGRWALDSAPGDLILRTDAGGNDIRLTANCDGGTNCGTQAILKKSGRFGLGTTSPATQLHLSTQGPGGTIFTIGSDNSDAGVQSVIELVTANGKSKRLDDPNTKGWQIAGAGNTFGLVDERNDFRIAYWDGSTMASSVFRTDFLIDSLTGNVGIGTPSPQSILSINSNGTTGFSPMISLIKPAGFVGADIVLRQCGFGTVTPANKIQIGSVGTTGLGGNDIAYGNGTQATGLWQTATFSGWASNTDLQLFAGGFGTAKMAVTSAGKVGIGTTAPSTALTVVAAGADGIAIQPASGIDAGDLIFKNSDGSERARIHSGNTSPAVLGFGTNGGIYHMMIDANGNMGIGITGPRSKLDVGGMISAAFPGSYGLTSTLCYNGVTGLVDACGSLRKFKENIRPLDIGLSTVLKLQPVTYRLKSSKESEIGFIAEDAVAIDKRFSQFSTTGSLAGIKYDKMVALLTKAIQEIWQKFLDQSDEIKAIKKENAELRQAVCEINPHAAVCR